MFYYFNFHGLDKLSIEELFTKISTLNLNIGQLWLWAIEFNHLHIVKALSPKIGPCPGLIDIVAEHGHIEMLIWMYNNRKENYTGRAIHVAASNGHLEVVKFLYNNLSNFHYNLENHLYNAYNDSIINGHLQVLQWLYYNTDVVYDLISITPIAIFYRHTDIIYWLKNEVCGR